MDYIKKKVQCATLISKNCLSSIGSWECIVKTLTYQVSSPVFHQTWVGFQQNPGAVSPAFHNAEVKSSARRSVSKMQAGIIKTVV